MLLINLLIGLVIVGLSRCITSAPATDLRGARYAGQQTCVRCHQDIADTYAGTAHFQTSSAVGNAEGLPEGTGIFRFSDHSRVQVENRQGRLYQVAYSGDREVRAGRLDIAFGSGEKARTFAFWEEDALYQLPLTYYGVVRSWTNSPGFPKDHPDFGRAIVSRCLECHSSFAEKKIVKTGSLSVLESVVKGSVLYGIDCERCHGPAARHAEFHADNPGEKKPRYLQNVSSLPRSRKLDMCAVCHSGNDQKTQRSTFAFLPGDTLANFYYPYGGRSSSEPDVHGNQYQMLAGSACFIKSDMDCSSCHNTHKTENNEVLFSQRCLNCHRAGDHAPVAPAASIKTNCIDCHMPMVPSRLITFQQAGKSRETPYLLRSHRIAVYPDRDGKMQKEMKRSSAR
ncbi:MAG TPA: hypothetical protein VGD92_04525 [Sphingobacteriaceae bacterium]